MHVQISFGSMEKKTREFTADCPETSVNFLDVTVSTTEGVIETDL